MSPMPKQRIHGKISSVSPLFKPPFLDADPLPPSSLPDPPPLPPFSSADKVVVAVVDVKTKGVAEAEDEVLEGEGGSGTAGPLSPGAEAATPVPGDAASGEGGSSFSELTAATISGIVSFFASIF